VVDGVLHSQIWEDKREVKKLLKVKIKREQGIENTHYVYPPQYNAQKISVITYETQLTNQDRAVVARGNKYEFLIGFIEEEDVAGFTTSPDMVEITRLEAEEFIGDDLDKTVEKINDPNAVLLILSKVARKEQLTEGERKAIDSNDTRPGIIKSNSLRDVLDDNLV